jgi:acetoin utilization protein AcuB
MYVKDFMTVEPWTIAPDRSIKDAKETMLIHRVRRLPVTVKGTLVGIITKEDILAASPSVVDFMNSEEIRDHIEGTTVQSIMAEDPYTVDLNDPIEKAAQIMREKKIGGIPVLEGGKLVGMITETDVFRTLVYILGIHPETEREAFDVKDLADAIQKAEDHLGKGKRSLTSLLLFTKADGKKRMIIRTRAGQ